MLIADQAGERVDVFLSRSIENMTRSAAARLLEEGAVLLCGKPVKKNYKMCLGDELEVVLPEPEPVEAIPQNIPLDVVYEDEDVIVVNKPVGMVVHPAAGHPDGTLVNALLYHCGNSLSGINGQLRPGIVHRIDRDTSGLIISAKNDMAHQKLADQLQDHSLYREYEAVCVGNLKEDSGTINAPIGRHHTDRKKMAVTEKNSKNAITHVKVLERFPAVTYIRCELETGRTHQIRVHLSHKNHPLLGDLVYGAEKHPQNVKFAKYTVGQCWHAKELILTHPRTGELMRFTCDLPEYFTKILDILQKTT